MVRRSPRSTLFPTRRSSDLPDAEAWLEQHLARRLVLNGLIGDYATSKGLVCVDLFTATADPETGQLRSEEHTSELQSHVNLVCRLLLEKKKKKLPRQHTAPN